jgi:high-affinity Fe2+/Pb2+ permease
MNREPNPLVVPAAISLGAIIAGLVGWLIGRDRGYYDGLRSHAAGFLIVAGAGLGFAAVGHLVRRR